MKSKLIVKQEESSDCGVCSLLSIIRYYGGNVSLEDLRINSLTTREGVSAYNLIECAKIYGFDAIGINTNKLERKYVPYIAHLNINKSLSHFVVVYKVQQDKVELMDPSIGFRKMEINEFEKLSSNNYILLYPKNKLENNYHPNLINKITNLEILNNKKNILIIIILNIIFIILSILNSFYIKFIEYTQYYQIIFIVFLFSMIITKFISYIINIKSLKLNSQISSIVLSKFINHIFNLPLNYIHIKDSGEIIKRVEDLEGIKDIMIGFIINLIVNILILIVISIVIFIINKQVFILSSLSIVIYIFLTYLVNRKITSYITNIIDVNTDYNSTLIDVLSGLNSINHAGANELFYNSIKTKYNNYLNTKYLYDRHLEMMNFLKQSLVIGVELSINTILIISIIKGNIPFDTFVIINFLYELLMNSVYSISGYIPSLIYQDKIMNKLNEFYNVSEEESKGSSYTPGDIKFSNVSFSYNRFNNVIDNFNINIPFGDRVILKGESGCGKSTICKILNKEYVDYDGEITINGLDLKSINTFSLRNHISYSSQSEKIFNGTIKDNILMGHEIPEEKLNEIISICEINRIIKKKAFGLDTFLYAGGEELSGGERQLIILARALVNNKDILVLDETMSEVNDQIEDKILHKLFNYYQDKTIIYVSHKNKKNYFERTIYV